MPPLFFKPGSIRLLCRYEVVPVFRARSGLRMNELIVLELNRCLISDA